MPVPDRSTVSWATATPLSPAARQGAAVAGALGAAPASSVSNALSSRASPILVARTPWSILHGRCDDGDDAPDRSRRMSGGNSLARLRVLSGWWRWCLFPHLRVQ